MKRFYGIALFFFAGSVWSATTIRGPYSTSQSAFASAATVTWAHFQPGVGVCPDNILLVCVGNDASTVSTVKYNGSALTQRAQLTSTETSQIWTLSNSTISGTNNIVVTNGGAVNVIAAAMTFCGANVVAPADATATSQATGTNPTIGPTVVSSGSWIADCMFNNGTTLIPNQTNQNQIISLFDSGGPSNLASHVEGPKTPGVNTVGWIQPVSAAWTKVAMSIKPSTGTPIMITDNVTAIASTTATGNGRVLNAGGYALSAQGICISTSPSPTTAHTCVSGTGTPYTAAFTGLTPGTNYHVRSYATNSEGTDYGVDIPFATSIAFVGAVVTTGVGSSSMETGIGSIQAN